MIRALGYASADRQEDHALPPSSLSENDAGEDGGPEEGGAERPPALPNLAHPHPISPHLFTDQAALLTRIFAQCHPDPQGRASVEAIIEYLRALSREVDNVRHWNDGPCSRATLWPCQG